MSELHEECGVVAVYHLPSDTLSPLIPGASMEDVSRLIPRMLLDVQNRGQLAAGITSYSTQRGQLIDTFKDVGAVAEVFHVGQQDRHEAIMREYAGHAAIGHVRYATCGCDDRSYAQPFERHHIKKRKWFSFAFNGQLANYTALRDILLDDKDNYLARETDTEIMMHTICEALSKGFPRTRERLPDLNDVCRLMADRFDGAYSFVLLNALGHMLVARDPWGLKPLSYAIEGPLFAAASESIALINLGFSPENIHPVQPGEAITIIDGEIKKFQFAPEKQRAHCFFEWVYFANVASTLDGRGVYMARKALGEGLAAIEDVPTDDGDTIVVPVPDTSKAAADGMAYSLGVPCLEGLIRNRYAGRTFIESGISRRVEKAKRKYSPLREVMEGKRVLLVEDSIVRSTTMRVLLRRIREEGGAKEIHVRVACPPITWPCFYGIDMSTIGQLFAPNFFTPDELRGAEMTPDVERRMAEELGADSLRYLPVKSLADAIGLSSDSLCQACVTGDYPTPCGQELGLIELDKFRNGEDGGRPFDNVNCA